MAAGKEACGMLDYVALVPEQARCASPIYPVIRSPDAVVEDASDAAGATHDKANEVTGAAGDKANQAGSVAGEKWEPTKQALSDAAKDGAACLLQQAGIVVGDAMQNLKDAVTPKQ